MSSRHELSMINSRSANPLMTKEDINNFIERKTYLNSSAASYDDYHDSGHSTLRYSNEDLDPRLGHYSFLNSKTPMPVSETALNTVKLNGADITGS